MKYYIFKKDDLLVKKDKNGTVMLPTDVEMGQIEWEKYQPFKLMRDDEAYLIHSGNQGMEIEGFYYGNFRETIRGLNEIDRSSAVEAKAIMDWDRTHQYCGVCGKKLGSMAQNKSKVCECGHLLFPELAAAVIVGIRRDDRILLAHNSGFPEGRYSIIAGFVELGEDLERAVRREIREEVGIEIENLQFFGSQSWPYPNTIMLGFTADYAGGEITPDNEEIMDADWYQFDKLPHTPSEDSIGGQIIRWITKTDGHLLENMVY